MPQVFSSRSSLVLPLALSWLMASSVGHAATARSAEQAATASQHIQAFAAGEDLCDGDRVKQAISLIYEQDDVQAAVDLAQRCEWQAHAYKHPFSGVVASRIQALVAMRTRDMGALKRAGEALVADAQIPEYVADGHMFIAFACLFGGNPACARTHVDQAKAMFTQLRVADALAQLQPLEQTLIKIEAQEPASDR